MDAINLLNAIYKIYKRELTDANEKRVMMEAQCELYKQQVEQLKKQLEEVQTPPKK